MKSTLCPLLLCLAPLAAAQVESGTDQGGSKTPLGETQVPAPSQNPPPGDKAGQDELPTGIAFELAHQYLDWMMGIAGNETVLYSDVAGVIFMDDELRKRANDPDPRVQQDVYYEALRRRIETLLRVQAGNDLGYDPELVDFLTDRNFELRIEALGGHSQASKAFRERSVTPEQVRMQIEDSLLERSWRESVTGKAPSGIGRAIVDRFVRPGWIDSAYHSFQASGSEREKALIGMHGERVILQVLVLDELEYPDTEQLGAGLRKRYEDGEIEFTYIVRTFGSGRSRERDGLSAPAEVQTLRQVGRTLHGSDEMWELARSGKVGQVTGPLLREREEARAWCLYRLDERLPATSAAPFLDRGLQHQVTSHLQDAMDRLRGDRAFQAVLSDSYVWPETLRGLLRDQQNRGN